MKLNLFLPTRSEIGSEGGEGGGVEYNPRREIDSGDGRGGGC